MHTGVNNHRIRHHPHHHHHRQQHPHQYHHRVMDDKDACVDQFNLGDPSRMPPEHHHPASASSLRRHVAAALMRHGISAERNNHALQPLSPASYGSSVEMAPYSPAITTTSSIEFKARIGDSSYSLKTSTELLKVLNRIWTLEEQHASNISLVKSLKTELEHARARIKELIRDKEVSKHGMDGLMKQVAQDKLVRKTKEHDRISAAIQSLKDELDDERKLRKRSETLHRKLVRELFEVKVAFSTTLKELEKERKSRGLLENLCDEFAKVIRDYFYGRNVHALKQKSEMNSTSTADLDSLILHISESWLDERLQLQLKEGPVVPGGDLAEYIPVVEKLKPEIESFIQSRQMGCSPSKSSYMVPISPQNGIGDPKENHQRRQSIESISEVVSAPHHIITDDSALCDSTCVEIKKPEHSLDSCGHEVLECTAEDAMIKSNDVKKKKKISSGRKKAQSQPGVGMNFEKQMTQVSSGTQSTDVKLRAGEVTPTEVAILQKPGQSEVTAQDGNNHSRQQQHDELYRSNTNTVDQLISEFLQSEAKGTNGNVHYESREAPSSNNKPAAASKRNISPVRKWMMSLTCPDIKISESSSKGQDCALKAKLQEPKSKGQRSRLKILKGIS